MFCLVYNNSNRYYLGLHLSLSLSLSLSLFISLTFSLSLSLLLSPLSLSLSLSLPLSLSPSPLLYPTPQGRHFPWAPGVIFGVLCLMIPLLTLFLPETHGREGPGCHLRSVVSDDSLTDTVSARDTRP